MEAPCTAQVAIGCGRLHYVAQATFRENRRSGTPRRPKLGRTWSIFLATVGRHRARLGRIRAKLGRFRANFGRETVSCQLWPKWGQSGPVLGQIWPILGRLWPDSDEVAPDGGTFGRFVSRLWPESGRLALRPFLFLFSEIGSLRPRSGPSRPKSRVDSGRRCSSDASRIWAHLAQLRSRFDRLRPHFFRANTRPRFGELGAISAGVRPIWANASACIPKQVGDAAWRRDLSCRNPVTHGRPEAGSAEETSRI